MKHKINLTVALSALLALAPLAAEEGVTPDIGTLSQEKADRAQGKRPYSPYANRSFLSRPLDFLVVSDHSDNIGSFPDLFAGKPEVLAEPMSHKWYEMIQSGKGANATLEMISQFFQGTFPKKLIYVPGSRAYKGAWQETIAAAEAYNDPGRFTAFIGYAWTSLDKGNNLHRNVIFRDNGDKASQVEPFTCYPPMGSINPLDLWKWMEAYEKKTGGSVLAIAHNGNLSNNGTMFPVVEEFGETIDRAYAKERAKWERLYETTQTKGDGEAHPFLSPNDGFADFETWDKGNLDGSTAKTEKMLEFEYARSALKNGLKLEAKLGVNPYKFGLIGSSDSHTGLAAMEEENFFGKTTPQEPSPERTLAAFMNNPKTGVKIMDWEVSASGYAAVWAQENTRESLWDAMQRKETYATTGPRMTVRFFGGWDFEPADAQSRNPAFAGYSNGVPMAGDLSAAPEGKSHTFLVAAMKDVLGGNLDRIQVIKGWIDAKGETQEKVYDVVWGGDRKPDASGKLPSVGSTVDVENATWTNTIGAPELITVWSDPEFDAKQKAFYYARVLEIPTPRWTAYDAKRFSAELLPGTRTTIIERAYTSPIWYTPAK